MVIDLFMCEVGALLRGVRLQLGTPVQGSDTNPRMGTCR